MRYEVEVKFALADPRGVEARLAAMGAEIEGAVLHVDTYLSHPARDLVAGDEALRIRRIGETNAVTYKGPKVDATTKTRREIELQVAPGEGGAAECTALFAALGFRVLAEIRKRRRSVRIPFGGGAVAGALDDVDGLGRFMELEIIADEGGIEEARRRLLDVADGLGLTRSEARSYLELFLDRRT